MPNEGETINKKALLALIGANRGKKGYAYTHKPVLGNDTIAKRNRSHIAFANANNFIIALSANDLKDADRKMKLGIGPVVVSVQSFDNLPRKTAKGHQLVKCPEQTSGGKITCSSCQLCAKPRKSIVVFENSSRRTKFKNNLLRK